MHAPDRRLTHHLAFAIAVKLLALAALWWFLVRAHGVEANTEQTAAHLLVPAAVTPTPPSSSGIRP